MKYPILSSVFALVASQAFLTPVTAAASKPSSGGSYTVKAGDSFAKIARARGVSLSELLKANRISNPDRIAQGQRIVIPGGAKASAPAKPAGKAVARKTEPVKSVPAGKSGKAKAPESPVAARKASVRPSGGAADRATTVDVTPPAATQGICVVQSGDTLYRIQRRTGVSVPTLLKLNGLTETSTLRPGQSLRISSGAKAVAGVKPASRPVERSAADQTGGPVIIDQTRESLAGTPSLAATGTAPHKVGSGETFSSISRVYGVTSTQLAAANRGVNPAKLRAGQTLMIPGQPVRPQPKPQMVRADGRIMADRPDPLSNDLPEDEMPAGRTRTGYLVEEGETIAEIAERFHTTEGVIRRMNRLGDSDSVYPGRYILVPFIRQAPAPVPAEVPALSRSGRRPNA